MSLYYHSSNYNLYISPSGIQNSGLGVFTKDKILKDSFIDFYTGKKVEYLSTGEYFYQVDNTFGIDASEYPRCMMAMINDAGYKPVSKRKLKKWIEHQYKNNCKFVVNGKKVEVYSIKDIFPGEELFISYGEEYWG